MALGWSNLQKYHRDGDRLHEIIRRSVDYHQTGGLIELRGRFFCSPDHLREEFNPVTFRNLLEDYNPWHSEFPMYDRLRVEMGSLWRREPQMLRFLLRRDGKIRRVDLKEALAEPGGEGVSFTHLISFYFGHYFSTEGFKARSKAWQGLLNDVLDVYPELLSHVWIGNCCPTYLENAQGRFQHHETLPVTPLVKLLLNANTLQLSWMRFRSLSFDQLDEPLYYWLLCLWRCGVDLEKYGALEQDIFLRHTRAHLDKFRWSYGYNADKFSKAPADRGDIQNEQAHARPVPIYSLGPRLKGFKYGPRPEDWSLIWDMEWEELVGDFWKMVEDRTVEMPGAWVDDD